MLDDLCLDVVEVTVQVKCLPASAFGTVALRIPQRQRDTSFATELALRSVDGDSAHHWHDAVLYLTPCSRKTIPKKCFYSSSNSFLKFGLQK